MSSSKSLLSALQSLLPTLSATNKPIPPPLLTQAESLLALSRQRASNLKPEEEIARAHACAEIACTRLRAQLRLPAIKNGAGAPCQPKVYAKLVRFLEGVLGDAPLGSLTPRGRKRDGDGNIIGTPGTGGSGRGTPRKRETGVEDTPSKKRIVNRVPGSTFAGTVKSTRKGGKENSDAGIDDKAPSFVMPTIRKLCKIFSTPTLVPHVYTGTCIVLGLSSTWNAGDEIDKDLKADILALATALYLLVLTKMQESEMTTEQYTEVTEKSVEQLDLGDQAMERVEEWIGKLSEEGWCDDQDWWESVPESVIMFDPQGNTAAPTQREEESDFETSTKRIRNGGSLGRLININEDDPEHVLLPGLGTMLHDGIDWTSTDKGLDYKDWQTDIMKRLDTPSKAGTRRGRAVAVG